MDKLREKAKIFKETGKFEEEKPYKTQKEDIKKVFGRFMQKFEARIWNVRGKVRNVIFDTAAAFLGIFPAMAVAFKGFAPFGLSYLAVEDYKSLRFYLTYIAVCIGSIIANGPVNSVKYIVAATVYILCLVVVRSVSDCKKNQSAFLTGSIMAISLFLSGGALLYWTDFGIGGFLLLICECLAELTVALMLESGREIIKKRSYAARKINDEEKLSIIVFSAIVLLSIKNLRISSFGISDYAAALVILIVAVACGSAQATVMGVILGIICAIGTDDFLQLVGVFGFSGFMAGFMAKNKKIGAIVGIIIANTVLTVYINGALENNLSIAEIALASVTLFIIPSKVFDFFKVMFLPKDKNDIASVRLAEMIKIKLERISDSFAELSTAIKRAADRNKLNSNSDVSEMFDRVADKICRNCKNSAQCWTAEFNATYQTMFRLLEVLEVRGKIEVGDVNSFFAKRCIKLNEFLNAMTSQFEVYKTTEIWKNRMKENREVITLQLSEVAHIINSVKGCMGTEILNVAQTSKILDEGFETRGIESRNSSVIANSEGRINVCTELKKTVVSDMGEEKLEKIVGGILGKSITLTHKTESRNGIWTRTEFEEEPEFLINCGIASSSKDDICGDSVKIIKLSDGKMLTVLSDGMGIGRRAANESETVVRLLAKTIEAGFEPVNAVRLINSVMLMMTDGASFSTVDVCVADLHTGDVKIIKTGAEPSYIKRGNELEVINANALPIGMLADAEPEEFETKLENGDMLIMVTDGVESKETGDEWLRVYISEERPKISAEDMANGIICGAYTHIMPEIDDDMTAVVLKLEKNDRRKCLF